MTNAGRSGRAGARVMAATLVRAGLLLGAAGALAACGGGQARTGATESQRAATPDAAQPAPAQRTGQSAAQAASAPGRTLTPVEASALRERAVGEIERAADSSSPAVRANAMESATLLGQRGHAVIARGLRDQNLGVRAVAAVAAGKAGATRLTPQIESLLFDSSPYARGGAIFALAKMGQSVDQTPLARMLLSDPQARVRAQAAFLLGELGNASALPLLREAATSRPARATPGELALLDLQVAEALVKLGDEGAIHGVRAALYPARPEDLEATALAVQVLGEVRDRASVSQLVALSTYRDRAGQQMPAEVRMNVAIALAKMGKREGSFIADEFRGNPQPVLRAQAASVYGFATADATNLSKLSVLLEDPEPMVRVAAAAGVIRATGEGSRRASAP